MRRASEGADCWTVSKPFAKVVPATTRVLVRTDGEGACMVDDGNGEAGGEPKRAPSRPPRRLTRSKHALDAPAQASPRRKRTRCAGPLRRLVHASGALESAAEAFSSFPVVGIVCLVACCWFGTLVAAVL